MTQVWSAIAYAGDAAVSMPLLRLHDLQPSTASTEKKLEEGQKAFDEYAVISAEGREATLRKMPLVLVIYSWSHALFNPVKLLLHPRPRALGKIRQKRLAAREQLRCIGHTLSILEVELLLGTRRLRPRDCTQEERRLVVDGKAFLWNPQTGSSTWDALVPQDLLEFRLVLAPDEGSSLFCEFSWLAAAGFRVNFLRDELPPLPKQYTSFMPDSSQMF